MATSYLLAAVLTIIGVLVQGQEYLHAQELQGKTEKLTEVAQVIIEDEVNSDIDFLLLGTANTRAECNQGKKCTVNKGGTCQKKGNACTGKIKKGCSKGCSCCVPDKITCKPSRRCTRANGACIARKECKGKIISKGCKKPNSCKTTHVCCVQDESTTEPPVCRGPTCPTTDSCPGNFVENFVCPGCHNQQTAGDFVKGLTGRPMITPYFVFGGKDKDGNTITYTPKNGEECQIAVPVQVWSCIEKAANDWTCTVQGFCTSDIKLNDGIYKPIGSLKCPCPNPLFERKHVCGTCKDKGEALAFVIRTGIKPTSNKTPRDIFDGRVQFTYKDIMHGRAKACLVTNPTNVLGWKCIPAGANTWDKCEDLGTCTNIISLLMDGHFEFPSKQCTPTTTKFMASP